MWELTSITMVRSPISLINYTTQGTLKKIKIKKKTLFRFASTLLQWAGFEPRSIFKPSKAGLNLKFSFSLIDCLSKAKEFSMTYYLTIVGGRREGFMPY